MSDEYNLNETKVFSLADLHNDTKKSAGLYFTLTVIEGRDFGFIFQVENSQMTIGRKDQDENKPTVELDDDRVSRSHLMLSKKSDSEGSFYVVVSDLDSKNGTYLNGFKLSKQEKRLQDNDKIQIGNTVLKFEIKDTLETTFHERLYQQVTRDAKTGLWNHNYARQEIEKLISINSRSKGVFSVLLMEIDFIQILNETYGQNTGDAVLQTVGQTITNELKEYEIAARFAGNQFLIILPNSDLTNSVNICDNIRKKIEMLDLATIGCPQRITISAGVSQFPICGQKGEDLIKQADEALFRAKQTGRNRTMKAIIVQTQTRQINKGLVATLVLVLLVSSLVYIGLYIYPLSVGASKEEKLIFSGTVEVHEVQVGSRVGGRVTEVLIEEGQLVKKDQVLVRFDISDLLAQKSQLLASISALEAELAKLENGFRKEEKAEADAEVKRAAANLEQLKNGFRPQEIAQVKADLAASESDLSNSEATYKRIEKIYLEGYQSKQARDDAETRVKLNKSRVEALKERLSLLEEGTRYEEIKAAEQAYKASLAKAELLHSGSRVEDIAVAKARLEVAKAQLIELNVRIKEGEVLAPSDSRVEVVRIRPGDIIVPGNPVVKLLENDQIWVRVYIPHTEIGKVVVGQKSTIAVDSFPNKTFSGYVKQIAEEAEFYPRNVQTRTDREHQVFAVKVNIDDKDDKLKSGMSADVNIESKRP